MIARDSRCDGRESTIQLAGQIGRQLRRPVEIDQFDIVTCQPAGLKELAQKWGFQRTRGVADSLAVEVLDRMDGGIDRYHHADVAGADVGGDGLQVQSLTASNNHRRQRRMTDVHVVAATDDLHRLVGAVAVIHGDIQAGVTIPPFDRRQMDGGMRAPGRPIEPHPQPVGHCGACSGGNEGSGQGGNEQAEANGTASKAEGGHEGRSPVFGPSGLISATVYKNACPPIFFCATSTIRQGFAV
jgi:hypothetical protein